MIGARGVRSVALIRSEWARTPWVERGVVAARYLERLLDLLDEQRPQPAQGVVVPDWVTHEFLLALSIRTCDKMRARAAGDALVERTMVELVLDWWESGPRAKAAAAMPLQGESGARV